MLSKNFWEELILDLIIEAEMFFPVKVDTSRAYYYGKVKHVKDYETRSFENPKKFRCPKCGYFHSSLFIKGVVPKRCFKCHYKFDGVR